MKLLSCFLSLAFVQASLVRGSHDERQEGRYYYELSSEQLGKVDPAAARGNPLRGLMGGATYALPDTFADSIDSSLEFYNIGLAEAMKGDNEFDWTVLEGLLDDTASRNRHAVLSFFIHWPGSPLQLPTFLLSSIEMRSYEGGSSPYYGDPILLKALQQFITALGNRYDGDKRIGFLHLGLLGFWGEFHTFPHDFVPEFAKDQVVNWYKQSFSTTPLQIRFPRESARGMGQYDGGFGYHTVDGPSNGNIQQGWFFWPNMQNAGQADFWKTSVMGGETRPELQKIIFTDDYPAGTENHQDFMLCVETTHASYVLHHDAFINGGYAGSVLQNALYAHDRLGYSYFVSQVGIESIGLDQVDVHVTVTQAGVAPFYYDLDLQLNCPGLNRPRRLGGVNTILGQGDSRTFSFPGVPATSLCLSDISLSLESTHTFPGRPIKFAQGDGTVTLNVPQPNGESTSGGAKPRSTLLDFLARVGNVLLNWFQERNRFRTVDKKV